MNIKVKTKAKTVNGILEAIINKHFLMDNGFSLNDGSGSLCTLFTRDAVKTMLRNFEIKPKSDNEFGLNAKQDNIQIEIYQQDWSPGFASYMTDGTLNKTAKAHVMLNVGGLLSAVANKDIDKAELPYYVTELLLHEFTHVIEEWAGVEFNEEKVEALIERYKKKYEKRTSASPYFPNPPSIKVSDFHTKKYDLIKKKRNVKKTKTSN